jgi:Domain of unknown function DUF29
MAASVSCEEDLHAWRLEQAGLLRARRIGGLDWIQLAGEIEGLAGGDRRELQSCLGAILLDLLKWQAQPALRGSTWRLSLRARRRQIRGLLRESPSLRRLVPELMPETYADAVNDAVDETGLPQHRFPVDCPYTPDDVLAEGYLPDATI